MPKLQPSPAFSHPTAFPPINFNYACAPPSPYRDPKMGYQVATYFGDLQWTKVRRPSNIILDDHLLIFPKPHQAGWTAFAEERDFLAAPWRLTLDVETFNSPPSFSRGTSINIFNLNSPHGQYVVDACQRLHDGNTYLRVLWRDEDQKVGNPYHPTHPAFILVVPEELNEIQGIEDQLRLPQVASEIQSIPWWHYFMCCA